MFYTISEFCIYNFIYTIIIKYFSIYLFFDSYFPYVPQKLEYREDECY